MTAFEGNDMVIDSGQILLRYVAIGRKPPLMIGFKMTTSAAINNLCTERKLTI